MPAPPAPTSPSTARRPVRVRLSFCEAVHPPPGAEAIEASVALGPGDTVAAAKAAVAAALGGAITPAMLALHFGPVDAPLGSAYAGDPTADEAAATLGASSSLFAWLDRFPHWTLGARPLPAAPPPPGVAAVRAAAAAEGGDPDAAVDAARAAGEIPRLADLPAPWGPRPYVKPAELKAV